MHAYACMRTHAHTCACTHGHRQAGMPVYQAGTPDSMQENPTGDETGSPQMSYG